MIEHAVLRLLHVGEGGVCQRLVRRCRRRSAPTHRTLVKRTALRAVLDVDGALTYTVCSVEEIALKVACGGALAVWFALALAALAAPAGAAGKAPPKPNGPDLVRMAAHAR